MAVDAGFPVSDKILEQGAEPYQVVPAGTGQVTEHPVQLQGEHGAAAGTQESPTISQYMKLAGLQ